MWPNPQETADLVTSTEEILNWQLHFLCSVLRDREIDLANSLNIYRKLDWVRGHPLSPYITFSEKLTSLTPWYAHVPGGLCVSGGLVRIRRLEMLVAQNILRTYLMDGPLSLILSAILPWTYLGLDFKYNAWDLRH